MLSLLSIVGVEFLEMLKGSSRVQSLGASQGAEADLVALSELHVTTEHLETLISELISRINDPPVGLHKDSRSKVVLRMPPVRGASGLAAGAEHAFVETIQKFSIFNGLGVFNVNVFLGRLALQEGLDLLVLGVEVGHVDDEILKDEHEHEGRDDTLFGVAGGDTTETGQMMASINVH